MSKNVSNKHLNQIKNPPKTKKFSKKNSSKKNYTKLEFHQNFILFTSFIYITIPLTEHYPLFLIIISLCITLHLKIINALPPYHNVYQKNMCIINLYVIYYTNEHHQTLALDINFIKSLQNMIKRIKMQEENSTDTIMFIY